MIPREEWGSLLASGGLFFLSCYAHSKLLNTIPHDYGFASMTIVDIFTMVSPWYYTVAVIQSEDQTFERLSGGAGSERTVRANVATSCRSIL